MSKLTYLTGLLMAMADSVPGISGGTIAFILGQYDELISSIYNLKDKDKRKASISFLIRLMGGWIIGFIFAMFTLSRLVETIPYQISSMFIGFILVSIPLTIRQEKDNMVGQYQNLVWTVFGFLLVFCISYFGSHLTGGGTSGDLTFGSYIYLFIVGMVAISSMLLPGISGSTILVIFGIYFPIVNVVKEILTFNFTHIMVVIAFGMGILVGAASFIKAINYLFEHYRSKLLYTIQGLMIGSLFPIIQGPTTIEGHSFEALSLSTFSIFAFIIGVGIILGIEQLRTVFEKRK